jgi:cytosine deaminase
MMMGLIVLLLLAANLANTPAYATGSWTWPIFALAIILFIVGVALYLKSASQMSRELTTQFQNSNPNRNQSVLSFMKEAIEEAKSGLATDGIPIGSILIKDGTIVGRGHNMRVQRNDPMAHAEIECLRNAGRIGSYRGATIYSTLMPCYLCAGAIVQFGIKEVIAGESETFLGARKFLESHGIKVVDLDLEECKGLMKDFIQQHLDIWSEDIGKL